ncbi:hypothetical protein [Pseudonocardia sp. H11422]|uniref:hypothetical protein n=1 Tax=Pseudonocardia sp. H11422 TaxID=2835866 RepID=UPI001BDCF691|nr:hypothetical protein [Pseudonocardia sp. H11422]
MRRELREELGAEPDGIAQVGVLESIVTCTGRPGHEIVFVFVAVLRDRSFYECDGVGVVQDEGSPVSWRPRAAFRDGSARLCPEGLLDLLVRHENGRSPLRGA